MDGRSRTAHGQVEAKSGEREKDDKTMGEAISFVTRASSQTDNSGDDTLGLGAKIGKMIARERGRER